MSNSPETRELTETNSEHPASQAPAVRQPAGNQEIQIDDTHLLAMYSNFCRATGTPEELIIDFGLNPHPHGTPAKPITVTQRVTLNYYTAKRLLSALGMAVQRHEAVFGMIETDVQKRLTTSR